MHSRTNASAEHLPNAENCALWLTNLPPAVTYPELLSSVNGIGRIWCTFINKPDNERHHTAAAKIVFFTPDAAQRLIMYAKATNMKIGGLSVKMTHNRIKYERHMLETKASRVLIITGKSVFVNEQTLTQYFALRFVFQVDRVKTLIEAEDRSVLEYRFGSYRCQAQMGKMALERDRPMGFEKVEFGLDPCEHGDILTSYTVAAERIQGVGF